MIRKEELLFYAQRIREEDVIRPGDTRSVIKSAPDNGGAVCLGLGLAWLGLAGGGIDFGIGGQWSAYVWGKGSYPVFPEDNQNTRCKQGINYRKGAIAIFN